MHISSHDIKSLKKLNNAFLNPVYTDNTEQWLRHLNRLCKEMTQAEKSTFFFPDMDTLHYYSEDVDPKVTDTLKSTIAVIPDQGDFEITDELMRQGHVERRKLGAFVVYFDQFESLFPGTDPNEHDIFNDVIVPAGIGYPISMTMPLKSGEANQSMLFAARPPSEILEKAIFILRKILPSFVSGVNGYIVASAVKHSFFLAFDNFIEAVVVVNTENEIVYCNKSWSSFLQDEPQKSTLKSFVHLLGKGQISLLHKKKSADNGFIPPLAKLKTNLAMYRAESFYLPEQTLGKLYLVIRVFREATSIVRSVANHYSLSERECEVAEHLILGEPNKRIAEHLFISEFTVRRHVESIFRKLHISSRAAVLPTMLKGD